MARERADLGNESRDPLYLISERGSAACNRSRMLTNPRDAASQQVQHVHLRLHRLAIALHLLVSSKSSRISPQISRADNTRIAQNHQHNIVFCLEDGDLGSSTTGALPAEPLFGTTALSDRTVVYRIPRSFVRFITCFSYQNFRSFSLYCNLLPYSTSCPSSCP